MNWQINLWLAGLTALVLVRVVAAVVHAVTDLVCVQADAVVSAAEGPGRWARVLLCGYKHRKRS